MTPPPPIAMLAELTHRCPLSCPYCSNPLELARIDAELDTGDMGPRVPRGRRPGRAATAPLGRGTGLAPRPVGPGARGAGRRALYQPHHLGHRVVAAPLARAGRRRTGPRPTVAARHGCRDGRRDRRLSRRVRPQDAGGAMDRRDRLSADAERRAAPAQPAPAAPRAGDGARDGRAPDRGRHRAVPRLGDEEPRRPDADTRAGRRGHTHRRRGARRAERQAGDRLCPRRLPRRLPQALHGRLGNHRVERRPGRAGAALPCRPDHPAPYVREGAGPLPWPRSGTTARPSTPIAAPTGCKSPAAAASARPWISAAAAARPWRLPGTLPPPIRSA